MDNFTGHISYLAQDIYLAVVSIA